MKEPIRFFAIGLLTSAVLMLGVHFFSDSNQEVMDNVPIEEMIAKVEEDGYRVITDDEFISYSLYTEEAEHTEVKSDDDKKKKDSEKSDEKSDDNKDKKDKKDKKEKKDKVKKVTFTTEEGVVSQDIADTLIENDIIDDRQKFIDYLEDNDYSPYIQLGTFEVTSDMNFKELAEVVTTYPGD